MRDWSGRFQRPQGRPFSTKSKAWMFDNEIDWVMRLGMLLIRREAREQRKIPSTFEYKAEHKQLSYANNSGKCSSKKSVFRSSVTVHENAQD